MSTPTTPPPTPQPVTFVELHSPDLVATRAFLVGAFGWDPQPFAAPDYLVAPADGAPGIDSGIVTSMDGSPRSVPIIAVASLEDAATAVREHGGTIVVEPFTIAGVGRGCYCVDPAGLLIGLHQNDPSV